MASACSYPETNVKDFDAFSQDGIRDAHLAQRLDGFGLQTIGSSRQGSLWSVIDDFHLDPEAREVVSETGFSPLSSIRKFRDGILREHEAGRAGADDEHL